MKPWKEQASWVKGGVIVVSIFSILSILNILITMSLYKISLKFPAPIIFFWGALFMMLMLIFCGVALPATDFGRGILGTCETKIPLYFSAILSAIMIIAFWFGIGAFIGWIFGKYKEERK